MTESAYPTTVAEFTEAIEKLDPTFSQTRAQIPEIGMDIVSVMVTVDGKRWESTIDLPSDSDPTLQEHSVKALLEQAYAKLTEAAQ